MRRVVLLFNKELGSRYPLQLARGLLTHPDVAAAFNCPVTSFDRTLALPPPDLGAACAMADYVLRVGDEHFQLPDVDRLLNWSKVVLVDMSDYPKSGQEQVHKCLAYVKRMGGTSGNKLQLGYCALDEYSVVPPQERDIDVAFMFDPLPSGWAPAEHNSLGRVTVYNMLHTEDWGDLKVHFGRLHPPNVQLWRAPLGPVGADNPFIEYLTVLRRAKVIFTVEPDHGGGDFRLWEAFASGALVVSNEPDTDGIRPYVSGKHYIRLVPTSERSIKTAIRKVRELLTSEAAERRHTIAATGWKHTMDYHRPINRAQRLMEFLNALP